MCPAVMLADSRTAKVRGRISFLINSIRHIKLARNAGVLAGKFSKKTLLLFIFVQIKTQKKKTVRPVGAE